MNFADAVVVVTGGAQGIGRAISTAFAHGGARVYAADVDDEAGAEFAGAMALAGTPVTFVNCDVAEEGSVEGLMGRVAGEAKRITVLVNNAGIGDNADILGRPMAWWDRVLAVNLRGPYLCTKYAIPHMAPGSAIVNIASTRGLMSEANTEPYSASKGGILALTHSLAVSLAERRIRVNAVSPGWIDVSNWKKRSARKEEMLRPQDHAQHPAGRVGVPQDIAEAVLFLADSDKAGFITGTNLVVDGGMTVKMLYEA